MKTSERKSALAHHLPVVQWTESALAALRRIGSRTIRRKIAEKVDALAATGDPRQLGKPLQDELQGLFRLSFGRYRIVYRVDHVGQVSVVVVMVGIRKQGDKIDVYEVARRLRRQRQLRMSCHARDAGVARRLMACNEL